jgi:hypothetical protein
VKGGVTSFGVADLCWGCVQLSEDGAVATQTDSGWSLATTGVGLTEGKHYWEAELISTSGPSNICIGISQQAQS